MHESVVYRPTFVEFIVNRLTTDFPKRIRRITSNYSEYVDDLGGNSAEALKLESRSAVLRNANNKCVQWLCLTQASMGTFGMHRLVE